MELYNYNAADEAEDSSVSGSNDGSSSDDGSDRSGYETEKEDLKVNKAVVQALQRLRNYGETEGSPDRFCRNVSKKGKHGMEFFCAEDTILSKNVKVSVDGIGEIKLPLDEDTIRKLIKTSKKAKFGKGEKTIMDVKVRDTQMIPASKLNVQIEEGSIANVAAQIAKSLNVNKNSTLVPHLYNMLIYGPGQFFSRHRDSEKVEGMVATMVILLPSEHKGGELIIEHQKKKHRFFGSPIPDIIKCVAFYSDCYHEVKKVKSGYRVALTYNLQLKCEDLPTSLPWDENLKKKVNAYFEEKDKLMFYLNHSYSEHSLKWNMLKSVDGKYANALLAVAKKENYVAYLALSQYHETRDLECYSDEDDDRNIVDSETSLTFLVDCNNMPSKPKNDISIDDSEICYTIKTKELLEPYETEETGPTGNEGNTGDYWYKRACVVLWPSNWVFAKGFHEEIQKLHDLTTQTGKQKELLQKIKEASRYFFNAKFWDDQNMQKFLDIAIYLKSKDISVKIFSLISPSDVLNLENTKLIACVKGLLDSKSWPKMVEQWRKKQFGYWNSAPAVLISILQFILKNLTYEHALVLLNEASSIFMAPETYSRPSLERKGDYITSVGELLRISESLNAKNIENNVMNKFETDLKEHKMIHSISEITVLNNSLPPKHFKQVYDFSMKIATDSCFKSPEVEKFAAILKFLVNKEKKFFVLKLVSDIKEDPKRYSPDFLCELFISLENNLTTNELAEYRSILNSILFVINSCLAKKLKKDDWSMPVTLNCNCQHCQIVQSLLSSQTSMSTFIAGNASNRKHVETILRSQKNLPLKSRTEQVGNRYRLIIEKSPTLIIDREKHFEKFETCKKKIMDIIKVQTENSTDSPPAKIQKVS